MCGISGIIGPSANPSSLREMLSKISHRGDEEHFAEMTYGNLYAVGTNRLAIVDPALGKQPYISPDGKIICICNGEIYNYRELTERYRDNYEFKTACDTETILAGYMVEGKKVFRRLRGMYAIFIFDLANGEWILARDHLGIKPIYFAFDSKENFSFSSELKALSGRPDIDKIETLAPGAVLCNGTILKEPVPYVFGTKACDETEAIVETRDRLEKAVKKMLPEPGGKLACLLSGGVDSSTVLFLARTFYQGEVEAFTFYNNTEHSEDYNAAKFFCDMLGVKLTTVSPPIEELANFYLNCGVWMTETFECALVRNAVSYRFLCEKVRAGGYKFALSGEGADEVFGGYDYFSQLPSQQSDKAIEDSLRQINRTYLQMADRASMFATLEVRVPYMDEDLVSHVASLPPRFRIRKEANKWVLRHLYPDAIPESIRFRAKTGMNQGAGYGSNDPGESIYHQAVVKYYEKAPDSYICDMKLARAYGSDFSLEISDSEEVYNFCRFWELGFHKFSGAKERLQLNTSSISKR